MNKIICYVLLLPLFLNPVDDTPTQTDDQYSYIDVTLNVKNEGIDETSKTQLELFYRVLELVKEINKESLSEDVSSRLKSKISSLFKNASEISKDFPLKKYLNVLSLNVLKGNFFSNIPEWYDLLENEVEIILKPHANSKKIEVDILLNNKEFTDFVKKYISVVDRMMVNMCIQPTIGFSSKNLSPIKVFDIVYSSNPKRFIFIYPDNQIIEKENRFKILVYKNVMELYFDTIIKPISQTGLEKKWADRIEFTSYFSNLIMHRISHYLGTVIPGKKIDEIMLVDEELKDLFYCVEEIKADTMALTNTSVLIKENLLPKEKERSVYTTYITHLLDKLRVNQQSDIKLPFLIQFNYMLKNGGIIFDINKKKLSLNMKGLKTSVRELMLKINEIEKSGSYDRAQIFIKEYNYISSELEAINRNLKKVPQGIKINFKFNMSNRSYGQI